MFDMLVESFHKDLGEDPGPTLNPHCFHLRYKISVAHAKYFHSNFSPALSRARSVLNKSFIAPSYEWDRI
jgi:hypothetical protein